MFLCFFSDILNVINYINGQYENANTATSLPLSPLRVNPGRIVYKRVAEGEYHVFLWADFFKDLPKYKRKKTKRGRKGTFSLDQTVEILKIVSQIRPLGFETLRPFQLVLILQLAPLICSCIIS